MPLVKHATLLRQQGRDNEITVDHHTALERRDDAYIDALTDSNVRFTISEVDQFLDAECRDSYRYCLRARSAC